MYFNCGALLTIVVSVASLAPVGSAPTQAGNTNARETTKNALAPSDLNIGAGTIWVIKANQVTNKFLPDQPQFSKRTDAFPNTNDEAVTIAVSRWWFFGQTGDQITALVNQFNARLTQIRVENPAIPTFTVTMVANTGAYSSSWWWYYGVNPSTLNTLLEGRRLISLDPYQTSIGLVFAAIMVPNTAVQGRTWWWYYNADVATVNNYCGGNNARLVSARPYISGNTLVYAVIMLSNTGIDS